MVNAQSENGSTCLMQNFGEKSSCIYSYIFSNCLILLRVCGRSGAYPGNAAYEEGIHAERDANPSKDSVHTHLDTSGQFSIHSSLTGMFLGDARK